MGSGKAADPCGAVVALVRDGVADAVMAQIYSFFENEALLAMGGDEVSSGDVAEVAAAAQGGGFGGIPGGDEGGAADAADGVGTVEMRWMEAQDSGLDESHEVDEVTESKQFNQGYFDSFVRAFAIEAAQGMNEVRSSAAMMGVAEDTISPVRVNIPFSGDVLSDIVTNVLRGIPYKMAADIAPTYFSAFAPYYSDVLERAVCDAMYINTVPFEDVVQAAGHMSGGAGGGGSSDDDDDDDDDDGGDSGDSGGDLEEGRSLRRHRSLAHRNGEDEGDDDVDDGGGRLSDESAEAYGSLD